MNPSLDTPAQWHEQALRQAKWTQMTRSQLYRRARLIQARRVLDVGCGTGAITHELERRTRGEVFGIDVDAGRIAFARGRDEHARYEEGDVLNLPYPDEYFDIVTCHFVLLWVRDPQRAVDEMARVTRSRGSVLICGEPDYGGRIDWPNLPIREWQIEGLRNQGANPLIGRQLRHLLIAARLRAEVGVIPSHWDAYVLRDQFHAEWAILERDVGDIVDSETFGRVKALASAAVEAGTRTVYVPTFYAFGHKG